MAWTILTSTRLRSRFSASTGGRDFSCILSAGMLSLIQGAAASAVGAAPAGAFRRPTARRAALRPEMLFPPSLMKGGGAIWYPIRNCFNSVCYLLHLPVWLFRFQAKENDRPSLQKIAVKFWLKSNGSNRQPAAPFFYVYYNRDIFICQTRSVVRTLSGIFYWQNDGISTFYD